LINISKDFWSKLSNKKYREHFATAFLKRSVAFQIKTLRKQHCGSQAVLAERSRVTQGVVSRAEDPDYGNLTFNTVGRIAGGLDMAFIGKFVPFSELARFAENLSEDQFATIPTFEQERIACDRGPIGRSRHRGVAAYRARRQQRRTSVLSFPVRRAAFAAADSQAVSNQLTGGQEPSRKPSVAAADSPVGTKTDLQQKTVV
jgi:transcriptional regulator with XRE-family HTH domain